MSIKIGNTTFAANAFDGKTLDEAIKTFKHIDKRIVERAYIMANPTPKRKRKKKKVTE